MAKPLYVTSTTHAMALWTYGVLTGAGLVYLFRLSNMAAVDDFFLNAQILTEAWAMSWSVAAAVGYIASIAAARVQPPEAAKRIRWWLLVEAGSCAWLTIVLILWLIGSIQYRGFVGAAAFTLFGTGYLCGCIHRIVQIARERPLLALAARNPKTAEVLADPDDDAG